MPLRRSSPRKAILRGDLPDTFSRSLYRVAPYKGCAHGCRYCDGRAEKYYVEGDFERDIEVRESIPELFATELPRLRERGLIAFGSGVTDPYQPCEASENLTGACARLLADSASQPALVMTKSSLVLRDLAAWTSVNERCGFVLLVSLTSLDEKLRSLMEPGASPFAERLAAIRAFKAAGCAAGILAMPLLPGISDGDASIAALYAAAAEAGADFVMPGGLTLRPGRQKELYLETLGTARPELLPGTREVYREERPSGAPIRTASRSLMGRIAPIRRELGMPWLLPHRVYARMLPPHDALHLLLRDMIELYSERGVDTSGLMLAADRYDAWLIGLRRQFRRKRSLPAAWLEERFAGALEEGELDRVLDNRRLASFAGTVLREGAILNFSNLRLESPSSVTKPWDFNRPD